MRSRHTGVVVDSARPMMKSRSIRCPLPSLENHLHRLAAPLAACETHQALRILPSILKRVALAREAGAARGDGLPGSKRDGRTSVDHRHVGHHQACLVTLNRQLRPGWHYEGVERGLVHWLLALPASVA